MSEPKPLRRRKPLARCVLTAGEAPVLEGKARVRIMEVCASGLAKRLDAAHLESMTKSPKRPTDTNQRAKSIVDIATGGAKAPKPEASKKGKKRPSPSKRQRETV